MEIREDLLYFIWKSRLFNKPLYDLNDELVGLEDPGQQNRDAGPDFFNARIRSEGILWAGNIEIHRRASEWYQHGHHLDPAFDNVILHVVLEPDCQVLNSKGREIRTAKLEIAPEIRMRYELLMENPDYIPCWRSLGAIEPIRFRFWLERLLVERLEDRTERIRKEFRRCSGDWNQVMFIALARAIGQKVNADPFEMLARSLPLECILSECTDQISREAILFGQAGLLVKGQAGEPDPYMSELTGIYESFKRKMGLEPLDGFLWKFLRLRPDNFPTIRISQLACSLGKYTDLFGEFIRQDDPVDFIMNLEITASKYWNSHFRFGRISPEREKRMGKSRLRGIALNGFLPILCAYRKLSGEKPEGSGLPEIMHRIQAEDNRVIRMWRGLGFEVPDALYSQALLQLTNNYCKFRRCLSCYVGSQIIQSSSKKK